MANANVDVIHQVSENYRGGWNLCFQWCRFNYDDGSPSEMGYRFIWRDEDDNLRPQRGQARIPSAARMFNLIYQAMQEGWFIEAESGSG